MAVYKRGNVWWYKFRFAGRMIRESAKTKLKTLAKMAEAKRRRELEEGFNDLRGRGRNERVQTLEVVATEYLSDYRLRHESDRFVSYAVGHLVRHLGKNLLVDITEKTVKAHQSARLREGAAPKTINEEVGILLRLLGDAGEPIRAKLRRQKALRLPVRERIGKPYSQDEKRSLIAATNTSRSPHIRPALMLGLNGALRDREIRELRWAQVKLEQDAYLAVGKSKSEAGEGRTIPLNSALRDALVQHAKWYTERFGTIKAEWYVFPAGRPVPNDPTRPVSTLKTAWKNLRKRAGVKGRWHDTRHTLITELAESGAGDEVIRDIAGHVSQRMLHHYSHIRMEAKRRALEAITTRAEPKRADTELLLPEDGPIKPSVESVQ